MRLGPLTIEVGDTVLIDGHRKFYEAKVVRVTKEPPPEQRGSDHRLVLVCPIQGLLRREKWVRAYDVEAVL